MAEMHGESPLATYADVLTGRSAAEGVGIAEVPFTAQIDLRVDPKSPAAERVGTALGAMLPNQPGDVVRSGELSVLWLGPDEWLIVGPDGSQDKLKNTVDDAVAGEHAAVVDVSGNRTVISVTGPKARELLNKGCALDLHPLSFETGRCAQTLLARAGIILVCRDAQLPSYWLLVRSSFARYLADWLGDAAAEYWKRGDAA